jgi:nitroimidazol reductase NimA-like FMN-containing flavoprotein (pyridoxamine 5'-phosphate oxidase superfamily)
VDVRDTTQRIADVRGALGAESDVWLATSGESGPHLVPISFVWTGTEIVVATPEANRSATNLIERPRCRLALGSTSDVVLIDGSARPVAVDSEPYASTFMTRLGWDPRWNDEPYVYLVNTPSRILAWRSEAEIADRAIMRRGVWVDA